MKLNAVAVSSSDMSKSVEFYTLLGFDFDDVDTSQDHVEPKPIDGMRLMIDSHSLVKDIIGEDPTPSNHSSFALEFDSPEEIDEIASQLQDAGFTIIKAPWQAFWGQYYCIVADPDGYKVDLYCALE